uniref:Secreted protein n=1 Tax=Angiostrongylus cantonensis TaxID=6313 RepID=A0A0K0DEI8_ANGCA
MPLAQIVAVEAVAAVRDHVLDVHDDYVAVVRDHPDIVEGAPTPKQVPKTSIATEIRCVEINTRCALCSSVCIDVSALLSRIC